ncbi:MAG: hypothetical protein IPM95_01540 [Sphingobacteriales bacterium]|nr:hypothetical protein [Sphingobacteriales bacterium]
MNTALQIEWTTAFDKTREICEEDASFFQYSVREKMMALIYTFLQTLQENELQFSRPLQENRLPFISNRFLQELKSDFNSYTGNLLLEGTNSGEIQARPFIANYYQSLLWNAFQSILYFWANDKSDNKENTDVMVEKTVHFTFDMLAPNPIDSGIDLAQHFFKLRKADAGTR